MRTTKSARSAVAAPAEHDMEADEAHDSLEIYRVLCPECDQRIGLLADEERLPEHALLPTARDPFGLAVCQGSGTPAAVADLADDSETSEADAGVLLTLPAGLDWRTQPFSHAGRVSAGVVPAQGGRP